VDKAGSDLYYLTEDCWAEDKKESIWNAIYPHLTAFKPAVGKGRDFSQECQRICLSYDGCISTYVVRGEQPQHNVGWNIPHCYMYSGYIKHKDTSTAYLTG
jgi:hypothetical protein